MLAAGRSRPFTIFFCNEIKVLAATMNGTHSAGIAVAWCASASPVALQPWQTNNLCADSTVGGAQQQTNS